MDIYKGRKNNAQNIAGKQTYRYI